MVLILLESRHHEFQKATNRRSLKLSVKSIFQYIYSDERPNAFLLCIYSNKKNIFGCQKHYDIRLKFGTQTYKFPSKCM